VWYTDRDHQEMSDEMKECMGRIGKVDRWIESCQTLVETNLDE
jgi:hypothetical protein